jgi:hypothetical protein
MSIWDQVTRIVVNEGRRHQRGDRVRLARTSLNPPELRLRDDPQGPYELLEATPLRIHGMKLMRVVLLPVEALGPHP